VSPSPHWSPVAVNEVPIFQALAAAQHDAWHAPDHDTAHRVFAQRLRQLLGEDRAEVVRLSASILFALQPERPVGYDAPPANAPFVICPRCQRLKGSKSAAPQHGRVKLEALRDREWLAAQFARGRTCKAIAEQLQCSPSNVVYYAERHELEPPRTENARERRDAICALHRGGKAPGEIARELVIPVFEVREALTAEGLATKKRGHHYFAPEWWIERIRQMQWTTRECARAAGIRPHECAYWLNKFGLDHITKARATKKGQRRKPKYPELADPQRLAELLREHKSYEAVGRVLGCSPSLVSRWARDLLAVGKRHENFVVHAAKSWWVERLDRGLTTWQLAEEAGIAEKSAREKLRTLGGDLLGRAYRNNVTAERERRKAS
jgi:AraC-like DNA-binding protein